MATHVDDAPSRLSIVMMGTAVAITAMLLVLGISWYGASWQVRERFWSDISGRLSGPMTVRFFLQPTLGFIAALKDGIKDARLDAAYPPNHLREGLMATSQMMLIGFAMDTIYQFKVFDRFYPVEAVLMVLLLAVIPYFLFRWVVEHIARVWFSRTPV
ncbi:MAG TPA: hypothetical protein VH436_02385 [Vicinamibacterales bacterium]|jgi:hypothetical protein